MATKTKNKAHPYDEPYDSLKQLHPAVWDHHGGECFYLQRTWRGNAFGRPGNTEIVVLTQVYKFVRNQGRVYMTQWEHHPDQKDSLPFMHSSQWEYTENRARQVWNEFVEAGAVRIQTA